MTQEHGPDRPIEISETDDDAERNQRLSGLRMPMTIIFGHAQLLRRRIRQGKVRHSGDCMETLTRIEWAIRDMETRLRALEDYDRSRELPGA